LTQPVTARLTCRLCDSAKLERVVELTPTPPGNRVLTLEETATPAPVFPLEVQFCTACFHVQLGHVVAPEILYRDHYSYVSGTSPVFVEHLRAYAASAISRVPLQAGDLVVDIGSNDGACLAFFQQAGMKTLGVDPATEIAASASKRGIETLPEFFCSALARKIRMERGAARLVTSHNACAHIDDLAGVMDGVSELLADDGLFVMEVGYFLDVVQNCWFDTIYHEHVDYHTVAPLVGFFIRHGMELVAVERIAPQGGSIRVIVQKRGGRRPVEPSVQQLVALEASLGLHAATTVRELERRLQRTKADLTELLVGLKREGRTIAGYGAPTKSTTLMLHFDLDKQVIDFIVDDNPLKQGFYTPGTHIPIGPASWIYERRPDYLLLLAWNFAAPIMQKHAAFPGAFILPMPEPKIVERSRDA